MPPEAPRGLAAPATRTRLIVNADDLGLERSITQAILEAHDRGIVTSASLMTNMPGAADAAQRARSRPRLGIGVHLNLSEGRPISAAPIASLVDERGTFLGKRLLGERFQRGEVALEDVEQELRAQVARAVALGIRPTHLDGHHGIHRVGRVQEIVVRLAREFGVPAIRSHFGYARAALGAAIGDRTRCVLRNLLDLKDIASAWQGRNRLRRGGVQTGDGQLWRMRVYPSPSGRKPEFLARLAHLPAGSWEMVVHPGYAETAVPTGFERVRKNDLDLVTDPDVISSVASRKVELISYREL
jgi:predicted glycoside hydrolase/deacetylase ChbG (UPF0249 family)